MPCAPIRMALCTARFMARRNEIRCISWCAMLSATSCADTSGPLDLLDVDRRFLAGELRQLVAQLVHLGAPLPDHHARPAGVHRDRDLARLPLDVDLRDRRMAEPRLEVLPDQLVLLEEGRHVLGREPARRPRLDDAEAQAGRMGLLPHYLLSFVPTWISTWDVRFLIGTPRPCAAG